MIERPPELEFWGEALVRWPEDVAAAMGLRPDDVSYLTTIGLPRHPDWVLGVVAAARGDRPIEIGRLLRPRPRRSRRARGTGGRRSVDGAIYNLEGRFGGPERRFVNSTVRAYGRFLVIYEQYRRRIRGVEDEDEALRVIDAVEAEMRSVDPSALAEGEDYWSLIVEQMRHGML